MVLHLPIKLSRLAKFYMVGVHKNNISIYLVVVVTNEKGYNDLLGYLYFTALVQPLQSVGVGMGDAHQSQSFHE